MKCIECKNFSHLANTEETRQGLCKYPMSYIPVCADDDCVYAPKPLTCKDCARFANDFACMTADENDPVEKDYGMCGGYIDQYEEIFYEALANWTLREYNVEEKVNKVLKDFKEEFKVPFEPLE